jgi:hypothetical protein
MGSDKSSQKCRFRLNGMAVWDIKYFYLSMRYSSDFLTLCLAAVVIL